MTFSEKPPMLTGDNRTDIQGLRDYLFRLAGSLSEAAQAPVSAPGVAVSYKNGQQILTPKEKDDADAVRQNARNLQALIIKSANDVMAYADGKVEEYNSMYVAKSEFGTFKEEINTTIENTARGVVESYNYASAISSLQDSIDVLQNYSTILNGEIRRGIVEDPQTHQYVLGIAISQQIAFTGEVCDVNDVNHPAGDSYDYYYISPGQTFGLYTATGWQFWVGGVKKGWYSTDDGMLHVANILVENTLQFGEQWELQSTENTSSPGNYVLELRYLGG